MLNLTNAFAGEPGDSLNVLGLHGRTVVLYPSGDTVAIRNAHSLELERILVLWEIFPSTYDTGRIISNVVVDSGLKLIAACCGPLLAAWYPSGKQEKIWRVHSSITLQDDIISMDCKSGLLAVGTLKDLTVYSLSLQNDLPTWSKKASKRMPAMRRITFSPSLTHLAVVPDGQPCVQILPTTKLKVQQTIRHPRPIRKIGWRPPKSSARGGDLVLYTVTTDSTARIFAPVLDAPNSLQLQATLDISSFEPFERNRVDDTSCDVFWWSRSTLQEHLRDETSHGHAEDGAMKRLNDILKEEWDMFVKITKEGNLVVRAVANIDSRPPTLLRQFTILQYPNVPASPPSQLILVSHVSAPDSPEQASTVLITSSPLKSFQLEPHELFDCQRAGLTELAALPANCLSSATVPIVGFSRTPDGRGVAIRRREGGQTCSTDGYELTVRGTWEDAVDVIPLHGGKSSLVYCESPSRLTLNDGVRSASSTLDVPELTMYFSLPSTGEEVIVIGVTTRFSLLRIIVNNGQLSFSGEHHLPLDKPPTLILPVDPMDWAAYPEGPMHDVLLCASAEGTLSFWSPDGHDRWECTGEVNTGRREIRKARCSSAKKTVLVTPLEDGEEFTIWDSKESEFSTGLEYREVFSGESHVNDLDWVSTPDSLSILAVGFDHEILLYSQQRKTYFKHEEAWCLCNKIDLQPLTSYPIADSIWLANGSLLVGAGHQMFLFSRPKPHPLITADDDLFEYVSSQNGPLADYHPQLLLQCLLWGKIEQVKEVILRLASCIKIAEQGPKRRRTRINTLHVEDFMKSSHRSQTLSRRLPRRNFDIDEEEGFSRETVGRLLKGLDSDLDLDLTAIERAHLSILIQTTLQVEEQRRALDENGLRYLISLRSFLLLNQRVSANATNGSSTPNQAELHTRERMRYRDFVWAYHSDSQALLLSAALAASGEQTTWSEARALGLFMWLNSQDVVRQQLEVIARSQYLAGEARDPTACSLLYFALGKIKLVHGLWKQAAWHTEQRQMLKFLANDFSQPRWKTAALKNAYALLGKQRSEYAAAFFLLGGNLRDAVNVCLRQLNDFQLALAIARVVEQSDDGPVFLDIVENTVAPLAFKEGNRFLASWAFWRLRRRDVAVRVLITPLKDLASSVNLDPSQIGEPNNDDPSLALLFRQLKTKSLQTVKGASEISGGTEFRCVLQMARVFCHMGCYNLALALVKDWSFNEPRHLESSHTAILPPAVVAALPTPTKQPRARRPTLLPQNTLRRSIIIDMDIPSFPPTRTASPTQDRDEKVLNGNGVSKSGAMDRASPGLGTLLKSAKKDTKVPEFDMSHFYTPAATPPKVSAPGTPNAGSDVDSFAASVAASPNGDDAKKATEEEKPKKPPGIGTFMKPKPTKDVVVPEFSMDNFF